ncbi:MAG: DNA gyrase inhibitor YacG [Acidobacteria bacterium]|nr:DNA gyrase inhibitor YacG [Acidobacteriota bacterium]
MKCPHCGKEIEDSKQPYRPFCSDRCKLIDLGKWISEDYRVPAPETENNDQRNPMKDPGEE